MAVIYVKDQGAVISKLGERIIVKKNTETLLDVPVIQVDNLAIIGNVQITMQALHLLMERGIDVSFFTSSGKFLGSAAADMSKNIFLRFEQYSFYLDEERRLEMAKKIVNNKINNQIAVIEHFRFTDYNPSGDINSMKSLQQELPDKESSNQVLGIEGMCSNIYFTAFSHMMKGDFSFSGRNRRPPKDPVNVILSLGYTLLTREICNALDAESFEPYLGFLHGIRYGRKSLALDVIEEFRQPIVDRLTILLFNKRMIGKYDFEFDEDAVILTEEGFKKFCHEYERWIMGINASSGLNYRKIIRNQIATLKRCICNGEEYIPYYWGDEDVCNKL